MQVNLPDSFWETFGKGQSFERTLPQSLFPLMERWELYRPTRYVDGHWPDGSDRYSCGFGHQETVKGEFTLQTFWTLDEARATLSRDLESRMTWVNNKIKAPLTTFMFGSLCSLVYQYGEGRIHPEFINLLSASRFMEAAEYWTNFRYKRDGTASRGLYARRCAEVGHFMTRVE